MDEQKQFEFGFHEGIDDDGEKYFTCRGGISLKDLEELLAEALPGVSKDEIGIVPKDDHLKIYWNE